MKIERPKTIPDLRRMKGIKMTELSKVVARRTYYRTIQGEVIPTKKTIDKLCELFEISEKTFNRLLKNTLLK